MPERILILGGTREASELAALLVERGDDVTTSLAGRTREPHPLAGKVRTGGFGGVDGMIGWCRENGITRIIDATHPFALQISKNAKAAAQRLGIPLEIQTRPEWTPTPGDKWHKVGSIKEAVGAVPPGATALLALGRQHIAPFAVREDVTFVIRMIDPPEAPLPFTDHILLLQRPSAEPDAEAALLRDHAITHIICRNSGGAGAYAKLLAARKLGLDVIMIERERAP